MRLAYPRKAEEKNDGKSKALKALALLLSLLLLCSGLPACGVSGQSKEPVPAPIIDGDIYHQHSRHKTHHSRMGFVRNLLREG